MKSQKILLFRDAAETLNISVHFEKGTFWLTQKAMATLFGVERSVVTKHLKKIFENCTLIFEKPLSIGQISFDKKEAVENHILMIGDTAGLIHPLCGNGMAMAIHSAKIASEAVFNYYEDTCYSRASLEEQYSKKWKFHFEKRLKMGRFLASILQQPRISSILIRILVKFPFLLPIIIKQTHGKKIIL